MKKNFFLALLFTILFTNQEIFAQTESPGEIRFYYGFTNSELVQNPILDGGAGYNTENAYEMGTRYILRFPNGIGLETGANFWQGDIVISSHSTGEMVSRTEELKVTSIPIFFNYAFWNYFFFNAGPVMDFQSTDNSFPSQSGIGIGAGLGVNYSFNNFTLFANPNFRKNAIIPFEKENHHPKLTTFGVQVGLGYKF